MIRNSLIICFVFLIIHGLFIKYNPIGVSQHQWNDNIIRAQGFLYDDFEGINFIIIGTSLSCRLQLDSLRDVYNLAFGGLSVFDGLELLMQKDKLPDFVLIETNFYMKKESENFRKSLFKPLLYSAKKHFPSLREKHQPVGILGYYFRQIKEGVQREKINYKRAGSTVIKSNKFQQNLIERRMKDFEILPNEKDIEDALSRMDSIVLKLNKLGVSIVFYEMPVNQQIFMSPASKISRERFKHRFSVNENTYIFLQENCSYQTKDGIHLTSLESIKFTKYFYKELKNITKRNQLNAEKNPDY